MWDMCITGADPSATNNRGSTPLHAACEQGHARVVELLLLNSGGHVGV